MTQQKKLKRAIRPRSRKTGESYAAARRHVVQAGRKPVVTKARPRRGEAGVIKKTGHGYDHWFPVLDAFGGAAKGHTASVAHLSGEHGVPGWHAQMITVEYERARGLRAMNQSAAGDFQVSVSRVVPVTVAEVVDALRSPRRRAQWLKGADAALGRALEAALSGSKARDVKLKSSALAALRYPWGDGRVEITIAGKPNGRTSVVASMTKLSGSEQVEERRAQWKAALDGLKGYLMS